MLKNEYSLEELNEQEEQLIFSEFSNIIAMKIGMMIIDKAENRNKSITVNIRKGGLQVFHYAMDGTNVDNDCWIARKNNVVNRFSKSSLYIGTKLNLEGKSIEEKYLIDSKEYAPYGGVFPINIEKLGLIGTITVSGMRQVEDHNIVVETLNEYLKDNKET